VYTFTKLHDRRIPEVRVGVVVGVGPLESSYNILLLLCLRAGGKSGVHRTGNHSLGLAWCVLRKIIYELPRCVSEIHKKIICTTLSVSVYVIRFFSVFLFFCVDCHLSILSIVYLGLKLGVKERLSYGCLHVR